MILDTNVLIALIDAAAPSTIRQNVWRLQTRHPVHINEIIFAEVSQAYRDAEEVTEMLVEVGVSLERLTLAECHRAGRAFAEYRRRNGKRTAILPDFLIGAQAELRGWPLITRDRKGFASYFPELQIIDPMEDLE